MLDRKIIHAELDRLRTTDPDCPPGSEIDRTGGVTRVVGPTAWAGHNVVLDFSPAAIGAIVARARQEKRDLMCFTFEYHSVSDAIEALQAAGLEMFRESRLLVADVAKIASHEVSAQLRQENNRTDLATFMPAIEKTVWGHEGLELMAGLQRELAESHPLLKFSTALGPDGKPVGYSWLRISPRGVMAGLFGGTIHPEHRGTGGYRAMVRERARLAHDHGVKYLYTSAGKMSAPILIRMGFEDFGWERAWGFPQSSG